MWRPANRPDRLAASPAAYRNPDTSLSQFFPNFIHPSGYFQTTTTSPREIGINVHYAFGPR